MEITIERLGINGEGISVINEGIDKGKVVFVENALPFELCDIEITKNTKKFAVGKVNKIITPSKDRVTPKCKYFGVCGGCHLQHLAEEKQKTFKLQSVENTIKKIAKIDIEISEIISRDLFNYRNKMTFPIVNKNGHAVIGMFKGETHEVVELDECLIANPKINELIKTIRDVIYNNYTGYDFKRCVGDVKYIVIRVYGDNSLVTVVADKKIGLSSLGEVLCKHEKNAGLSLLINKNNDEIMTGKYMHVCGLECLKISEFGIDYEVNNLGFLQVNNQIKEKLYNLVLDNLSDDDVVLDGYSGAGLLSAIISKKCKKVIGVEINHSACESAKKLIKNNNLQNIEYYEGDVKKFLDKCIDKGINSVVLDPPRSGCDSEILNKINNIDNINKIIYISCNPATLARDLAILKDEFEIKDIKLLDMFPNTKHVETLVVLKRMKEKR